MSEVDLTTLKSASVPIRVALVVTLLVGVVFLVLSFGKVTVDGQSLHRWQHFMKLPPNAMADTLAGIGATLTLIWVVASVFQQSFELRAQREEFQKMAEKQGEQGETLNLISTLAAHEQSLGLVKTRIADLRAFFSQIGPHRGSWYINEKNRPLPSVNSVGATQIDIDDRALQPSQSDEFFAALVEAGLSNFVRDTRNLLDQNYEVISYPGNRDGLISLRTRIRDIVALLNGLPATISSMHELERWERIVALLTKILNDKRLWTDNGWVPNR